MENNNTSTTASTTINVSSDLNTNKFSDKLIHHYLYGYKEMRLVSSEEVISTLMKGKIRLLCYYKHRIDTF